MKNKFSGFLLSVLLSCSSQPVFKENKTVIEPNLSSPFKLELQYQDKTLSAFIRNMSNKNQLYFYHSMIQPSKIILLYEGKELQSFDSRQIMKYNNRVEKEMFTSLAPNEKKKLFESRLVSGKSFFWGTYQFKDLPSGSYELYLEWLSAIKSYYDSALGKIEELDVWTDEKPVYSDKITVEL